MTEKKITILGEEVVIRFNMAVEIAYEEIVDAPFNAASLQRQKDCLALGIAAIITCNPDTKITMERLLTEATGSEMTALNNALAESMKEWFEVPVVEKQEDAAPAEGDEQPKN